MIRTVWILFALLVALLVRQANAQSLSQRGFVEAAGVLYPQDAPNDQRNGVADLLVREEVFARPAPWLRLAAGIDLRANSYNQVDRAWRVDGADRRSLRPAISVRRLAATLTRGPISLDLGRQFLRWGKTDIVNPTDHFAPRDFLNVIDSRFLGVTAARATFAWRDESVDLVWAPIFTPSRVPLLTQRWTVVPPGAEGVTLTESPGSLPSRAQVGVRWSHTGRGYEVSVSAFDGFNHLPNILIRPAAPSPGPGALGSASLVLPSEVLVTRQYPRLRSIGADAAVPTRWVTLKGELAFFGSPDATSDEFVLYVVQAERQTGEWLFVGGYVGEVLTERRARQTFAPNRGLARSFVGRASYTIDTNRSTALEASVRQDGAGVYVKGEYSQAKGQHWRATLAGAAIGGSADDFIGQYDRNSHASLTLRYSF